MKIVKLSLISLLICASFTGFAQKKQEAQPNDMDEMYVPPKNSIFNPGDGAGSTSGTDKLNAVKFNPLLLTRSIGAVFYERWLTDGISVQAGLGMTYNKDRIMGIGSSGEFTLSDNSTSTLTIGQIMDQGVTDRKKLYASLGFRFFWGGYYDANNYFELGVRYYANSLLIEDGPDSYNPGLTVGTPEVTVKNTSFNMVFGHQVYTDGKVSTAHDFYFGFGIRSTSYDVFKSERRTIIDSSGYSTEQDVHSKTFIRETILAPSLIMGYAFGFAF